MAIQIRKAQRAKAWLKLVIDGVSGSGKTYSALQVGKGLGPEPKVILIDTENGSGELYSHLYEYDYIRLEPPFSPSKYIEAIDAAVQNGNDVIILDSLSHCWKYILSYKESLDAANPKNSWGNWAKAKALFDEIKNALLQCPAHIVATLRAGSEYAESYDAKGNKTYTKVGTKPIAEPDLEFEFTLALRIERSHLAIATKDRTEQFDIAAPFTPSVTTGRKLYDWLMAGSGELSKEWAGALKSEEAQRAVSEAERLGIGEEGATDEDLARKATELLRQKQREANETIKALKLDADKEGLKTFAEKAKGAGLDPLELFWEFTKKREGLKSWAEYQVVLDEFVAAKNESEGASAKPSDSEAAPTSTGPSTTSNGDETLFGGKKPEEATPSGEAEEPTPKTKSEAISKLRKAFNKSPEKDALTKRVDVLGLSVDDVLTEAVAQNLKADMVQVVAVVEMMESRGR